METITIEMKPELVRYLYVLYAQSVKPFPIEGCRLPRPIQLPYRTSLYHVLGEMTVRQPAHIRPQKGNITFALPAGRQSKNPKVFNYLGERSIHKLEQLVRNQMKLELFEEMIDRKLKTNTTYTHTLREFTARYGIEDNVSEESLMRLFQMWRRKRCTKRRSQRRMMNYE